MQTLDDLTNHTELIGGPHDGTRLRVLPDQTELVLPLGSAARHAQRFSRYVADGDGRMTFRGYCTREEVFKLK